MAKDKYSTSGPTMQNQEALPPNPADALRNGPLPTRREDIGNMGVIRREFNIPTKPTLHRQDGLDGAAEANTVTERRFRLGTMDTPPYPGSQEDDDSDFANYGAKPGENPQPYSKGANPERTERGQIIRGT